MLLTSRKSLLVRKHGPSVPGGLATWDPVASTNVTLSGGNLVATNTTTTSGASPVLVRTHTTGKYYFEITWTGGTPANSWVAALNNVGTFPNNYIVAQFSGAPGPHWAVDGTGSFNAATQLVSQVLNGDVEGIAIDLTNHFIWTKSTSSLNWNNDATANPNTPSGGVDLTVALPGGTGNWAFQVLLQDNLNQVVTLNPGPTFNFTPPTGFTTTPW